MEKYNVSLKKLLQQHISGPEFYGDLGRIVRREQSSSIAIELTFAPPQIKGNINDYIWSKNLDFYL